MELYVCTTYSLYLRKHNLLNSSKWLSFDKVETVRDLDQ